MTSTVVRSGESAALGSGNASTLIELKPRPFSSLGLFMRLLFLFMTTATIVLAAPLQKNSTPGLYLPVEVGAKRVTEVNLESQKMVYTETVTKVEEKDGRYTVTIDWEDGVSKSQRLYEVSKEGVFWKTQSGKVIVDQPVLKLPYREGASWTIDLAKTPEAANDSKYKVKYTIEKEEFIELKAGKYYALRVTYDLTDFKVTEWHAAGIGRVKMELPAGTIELKSFTPGKSRRN